MSAAVELEGVLPLPDGAARLWLGPYDKTEPREANLRCYDRLGEKLWDAETLQTPDKWVGVRVEDKRILANSWSGFLCELDPKSGKIISSTFVK